MPQYFLYILSCRDQTFYTGISTNLNRRVTEHNTSKLGAKYTRGRRPVKLVFFEKFKNLSLAAKEESIVKKLSRSQKIEKINNFNNIKKLDLKICKLKQKNI
ncbi:MAG: GIY-YIG nuclease family protein [Clostridia bacterium]|nr:GIY-YIG nuclease family protein [Clostridia bacterium]